LFTNNNGKAPETYEKIQETSMPRGQFKHRYSYFADTPISVGAVAFFKKIYDGDQILTVFSQVSGRMYIQYRYSSKVYDVKSVSQRSPPLWR
jgi:hypothetical protein